MRRADVADPFRWDATALFSQAEEFFRNRGAEWERAGTGGERQPCGEIRGGFEGRGGFEPVEDCLASSLANSELKRWTDQFAIEHDVAGSQRGLMKLDGEDILAVD